MRHPDYYRAWADEMRALADAATVTSTRRCLQQCAEEYEHIAKVVETLGMQGFAEISPLEKHIEGSERPQT
jgi:hypothetical protein